MGYDRANNGFLGRNGVMASKLLARLVMAAALAAPVGGPALAQDVAGFYRGKTITMIVGSSAGGGYDLYGRLIARHMGKHIPGNPSFVVQNMPGAASNVAASHIYNVGAKDGTVIGAIFMGAVVDPLFGSKARPTHDISKFHFIGNANKDVYVCLIRADAPVKSFGEVMDKELVLGSSAEGASTRDFPMVLKNLLGAKFRIVSGYPGTREINMALERGEVQGGCGQSWSSVSATYPHLFKEGKIRPLVQEDTEGYPDLNKQGVPLIPSFAKTDEQKQILDLYYSQTYFGRPYVVAPEVPKERVDALRKAFMATMRDPELVAEAKRMEVDAIPVAGEELQAAITKLYAAPAHLIEKAKQAVAGK
jgi:tripartite-type tricarboxylate transporter receptor subunit TctC